MGLGPISGDMSIVSCDRDLYLPREKSVTGVVSDTMTSWFSSGVVLYSQPNYKGASQKYTEMGTYPLDVSPQSFTVPAGWSVSLYFDRTGMMPIGTYSSTGTSPVHVAAIGTQVGSMHISRSERMTGVPSIQINAPLGKNNHAWAAAGAQRKECLSNWQQGRYGYKGGM
jgi:hypothetical protein